MMTREPDPIKIILSIILSYSDFKHADLLQNVEQPIRMLENERCVFFAENLDWHQA